jgi:hypothetical protein
MSLFYSIIPQNNSDQLSTRQQSNGRSRMTIIGNDCFPNEIFYLIVEFYTNSIAGLLTFKTICRNWQLIGESSLLWLTLKLEFFSPVSYVMATVPEHYRVRRGQTKNTIVQQIEKSPRIIVISTRETRLKKAAWISILVPVEELALIKLPLEQAKFIHDGFLYHFRNYHKKWEYYTKWKLFIGNPEKYSTFLKHCIYSSMVVNSILLFLCMYLFRNLSTTPQNNLSITQQMGFLCLYLIWFLYALCIIIAALVLGIIQRLFESRCVELYFALNRMHGEAFMFFASICCVLPIVLINLKLTVSPDILWSTTTVPLWVLGLICSILIYLGNTFEKIFRTSGVVLLTVIIILPLTLIGYSVDNGLQAMNFLKYTTIAFWPLVLLLFVHFKQLLPGVGFHSAPQLSGYERLKGIIFTLVCILSCIATCFSLIILFIAIWKGTSFIFVEVLQPVGILFLFLANLHISFVLRIIKLN